MFLTHDVGSLLLLEYGLGSMVYTKDSEKAVRIASLIDAGQVGINCYPLETMTTQCPWYVSYSQFS